ncbi:putative elastin-like [Streptomyces alboflavus]|uniref:Putative elastin-like n=1 Tax=Streptomyces alboflavus TaxID=67267 RepID=A0A1Z1W8L9_9ACTN|nr:putative elastin-like [Streptomyces alboflavus]
MNRTLTLGTPRPVRFSALAATRPAKVSPAVAVSFAAPAFSRRLTCSAGEGLGGLGGLGSWGLPGLSGGFGVPGLVPGLSGLSPPGVLPGSWGSGSCLGGVLGGGVGRSGGFDVPGEGRLSSLRSSGRTPVPSGTSWVPSR